MMLDAALVNSFDPFDRFAGEVDLANPGEALERVTERPDHGEIGDLGHHPDTTSEAARA